jgi:hypothetical protein
MDKNEYAKQVYGLKVGDPVSPAMGAQIEKELEYYRKKKVDALVKQQFEPAAQSTPDRPVGIGYITNAPRVTMETDAAGNVITNTNSGPIVHQVEKFSDGTFKIIPQSVQSFRGGSAEMVAPGTSRPITNEITGEPEMNYSSDPSTGGAPPPGIGGGGMAVTNAPTAAPTQTPAPAPTPPQLRDGMRVRQGGITYVITNGVPVPVTGP